MGNAALADPFPQLMQIGYDWQLYAVQRFLREGFAAEGISPLAIRPSLEQYADYTDEGDIRVQASSGRWAKIDIKSRRTSFTGPEDYPHRKCIVGTVRCLQQQSGLASVHVVSQRTRRWVVVPMSTRPHWRIGRFSTPDGPKDCYWLPPRQTRSWDQFLDWLWRT